MTEKASSISGMIPKRRCSSLCLNGVTPILISGKISEGREGGERDEENFKRR